MARILRVSLFAALLLFVAFPALAQEYTEAGRYDDGKMWTFEYPPIDYLAETYDFHPDAAWFESARLSVLRIPGCSASFVSDRGLVVTNHHCVRGRVPSVQQDAETLLDDGFYAETLADERRIPGYYADQLIAIEDVTAEMERGTAAGQTEAERSAARDATIEAIQNRLEGEHGQVTVQVIGLYNGGRYSAYVFRRYGDVRLVMAVELQLGFFGGDGDNFTYPRYALDYAFLRVYGDDGLPLATPHHFTFSEEGVSEGDLIFVIGNPGSTTRQATVSQLEYLRDVTVANRRRFLTDRLNALRAYYDEDPETGEAMNLRNTMFGFSNSQKAYAGRYDALRDPMIMARRADAEKKFRAAIAADAELKAQYGLLHDGLAEVNAAQIELAPETGAFQYMESGFYSTPFERRMILAHRLLNEQVAAPASERATELSTQLRSVRDQPVAMEQRLLALRLADFERHLGADDPITVAALRGATPDAAAATLLQGSVLASAEATAEALDSGTLSMDDPGLSLADVFMTRYANYASAAAGLNARESEMEAAIGRARFAVHGVSVPPDATFSPRITDGVVKGYAYNGTLAHYHTTLYGLYDRFHSFDGHPDWQLPARWQTPPKGLDLGTSLNFVSTSDTIGGNSGSPAVTPNLEIVGLNFDRNIEGLSRDYIYLPDRGRNIMVDMRAVKATLGAVYGGGRIVDELTSGTLQPNR